MALNMRITDLLHFQRLSILLNKLYEDLDLTEETIVELSNLLPCVNKELIEKLLPQIFIGITKCSSSCSNSTGANQRKKCLLADLLKIVFTHTQVNSLTIFFQFYIFLLNDIYDPRQQDYVANIHEEYKLSIMAAMVALSKSLSDQARKELYTLENAFHLSRMLCIALTLAQKEKLQSLRLTSIECVMSLTQICDDSQIQDRQLRKQVANIFVHFAPGIISGLSSILKGGNKCGHKIILLAFRGLGRFVALQMENYNNVDVGSSNFEPTSTSKIPTSKSMQNRENIIESLKSKKIDAEWYRDTDEKLCQIFGTIAGVTWHSHQQVRLEVAVIFLLLVEHCADTIPNFASKALETLIKLSEDESEQIADMVKIGLKRFQDSLPAAKLKDLFESLEEAFFRSLSAIPRIFNSFDEEQQLSSLNLLVGHLRLFGSNMPQVLHSVGHSQRLIDTLIHISEFERKDIRLFEEYVIQDLEQQSCLKTPWKSFRYINSETVQKKLETACEILAKFDANEQISYLLLDIFISSNEHRREVTYILNNMLSGIEDDKILDHLSLFKNVCKLYIDSEYWNLPIEVSYKCQLFQVQYNIIQICLQLEGIGKIAIKLNESFQLLLLPALAPVLERAGSTNSLIKLAGTMALTNISKACDYPTVSQLIQCNYDYLNFHISNKIRKSQESVSMISILTTVLRYSDISNMSNIIIFITDVLAHTYYKYFQEDSANVYLYLFKIFTKALLRWLSIEITILPIKSKQELADEYVEFQVSDLNFDDDCNEKTVEEMYQEDLERNKTEDDLKDNVSQLSEVEDDKQRPPHITVMVDLLNRVLNFLPSKDKSRKLLALDILIDGLEVLRDWENDLLPLVHKIWGPFIGRFREVDEYLIINRSFELLVTLARLSKDFIRSRTVKDVLPNILNILKNLAEHSYLKDHGAAYRYTQAYKLQLNILQHLSKVVINVDVDDNNIKNVMKTVLLYLSSKQCIPLQQASIGHFNDLMIYDRPLVIDVLEHFLREESEEHLKQFKKNIECIIKDRTTD
ncbi:hypothetical protein RI129_001843 [Pyrocoelia pectoralis]|uniref:TELO2-interacting protein 1 n=1 Tax=Pyrocoelia pectoralis TaxID=417401 RepID=A0AAN7VVG8_9COLE